MEKDWSVRLENQVFDRASLLGACGERKIFLGTGISNRDPPLLEFNKQIPTLKRSEIKRPSIQDARRKLGNFLIANNCAKRCSANSDSRLVFRHGPKYDVCVQQPRGKFHKSKQTSETT
jgi:hypothetical protein